MNTPLPQVSAERALENLTRIFDRSLGLVVAIIMFFMMVLTFVDVMGRQVFDSPVPGGGELTEIALSFVVYMGLPLVCLRREHITIGLMAGLMKGRLRQAQHVILNLIFAGVTFIWGRQVWIQADSLAAANNELMFLKISVAPFVYVMSAFAFFAMIIFLFLSWCYVRGAEPRSGGEGG
jgi:TRAP-type C4-dicarboxylate transport system permease small subunit